MKQLKIMLHKLQIRHKTTTAFKPSTNGLTERFNKSLIDILSKYIKDTQKDWDVYIKFAVFSYNTSKNLSTGYSPYEIVYGKKPLFPF